MSLIAPTGGQSTFWAVTSYFNPLGYQRRRANYRAFRRHLNVPLATIEWSPTGQFELEDDEADLLVRVHGGGLLWQKERLLNVLVPQLPADCQYVAMLDCDIVFDRSDWAQAARAAMQTLPLVQLFDTVHDAEPVPLASVPGYQRWDALEVVLTRLGFVSSTPADMPLAQWMPTQMRANVRQGDSSPGFAWAAWRSLLQRHPLIDVWVAGGGDVANCFAALGVPEAVIQRHQLTPAHAAYYLPRARALAQTLGGRVGHVPGTIRALWHGDLNQRGYRDRHGRVAQHGFDPARFLQLAPSGVWAWTDIAADLADDLREHFIRRNEDGLLPPPPPLPPAAG